MVLRKWLRILVICLVMVVSGMDIRAEEEYTEGYLYYTIEDGGIVITGYFGDEKRVVIPNEIGGLPVYKIESGAFAGTTVEELVLPDTIMTISEMAIAENIEVEYTEEIAEEKEEEREETPETSEKAESRDSRETAEETISETETEETYAAGEEVDIEDIEPKAGKSGEVRDGKKKEEKSSSASWMYIGIIAATAVVIVLIVIKKAGRRRESR